jgi:hypothetical protein
MPSGPFIAPVPTPKLHHHAMQLILEALVLRALVKEQVPELLDQAFKGASGKRRLTGRISRQS